MLYFIDDDESFKILKGSLWLFESGYISWIFKIKIMVMINLPG